LASGLSETEMEEIRKQNQEQLGAGASSQDLSMVMELSKRDEEARLNRLREEEEELEKVCFSINLHYLSILQTDIIRFFL
jgi:hypothetical protein